MKKKNHLLKNLLLSLLIPCAVLAVLKIIALAKGVQLFANADSWKLFFRAVANVTLTRCDDRFKRYREDYKETVYVPFEMMSLPCPRNWQRCLELQYGKDWQTPVKGTQYHSCWIYDSDNAYNDYVRYLTDLILNRI